MLLYHKTDIKSFKRILDEGKLKPSSKTKNKNENPYDFFSPYIFFNTIPKTQINSFTKVAGVGIIFKQDILLNKVFYSSKCHSAGNTKLCKKHVVSDTTELTTILYALYRRSLRIVRKIKMDTWILSAFQEVYTRVEPKLHDAMYIIIHPKELKTIKKLRIMYPTIKIIQSESTLHQL